jgi:tRNA(Ile)-lysidine synthase TilS/MesJ
LLAVSKDDLKNYLRRRGLPWCEDGTNGEDCHVRNRLRHRLIPLWKSLEPRRNWEASVGRTRELLVEDGEALDEIARECYDRAREGKSLRLDGLCLQPPAIIRRVLYRFFLAIPLVPARGTVDPAIRMIRRKKPFSFSLARHHTLASDGQRLFIRLF